MVLVTRGPGGPGRPSGSGAEAGDDGAAGAGAGAAAGSAAEQAPDDFLAVTAALRGRAGAARPEVAVTERAAPSRVAPFGIAFGATVAGMGASGRAAGGRAVGGRAVEGRGADAPEVGAGRLVVLHDPAGQPAWDGDYRVACYARASLDLEMVGDPVLPEVTWSWLQEALAEHGATADLLAGTVTTTAASRFGSLASEGDTFEVELRCSWSPRWSPDAAGAHLDAFVLLLATMSGLPPDVPGVVSLASRARPS